MRIFLLSAVITVTLPTTEASFTQPRWSVDTIPITRILSMSRDNTVHFSRPSGATRLSNGTIIVADATSGSLSVFAPDGKHLRAIGRSGDGPGEFGTISWLGNCGRDSVFVWDLSQERMTVIGSDLRIARQYNIPSSRAGVGTPAILACSRERIFASLGRPPVRLVDNRRSGSAPAPLTLSDARGNLLQLMGDANVYEYGVDAKGNIIARPLGKVTSLAVTSQHLFVGTADSASIDVYSHDGQRRRSIPIRVAPRKATQQLYDRAADELVKYSADSRMRDAMKRQMLAIPMPEFTPPYSSILADFDGIVWAVVSFAGDPYTQLIAFNSAGRQLTDLRIPPSTAIYEIGRDYILAAHENSDGEASIIAYRLRRE